MDYNKNIRKFRSRKTEQGFHPDKITKDDLDRVSKLEEKIGYVYTNKNIALEALTHTSYANEIGVQSNERLEFLGDSILSLVVSTELYFENATDEGNMTKKRAQVVCEESLYEVAQHIGIEEIIRVGKAQMTRGEISKAILADAIEAIIASIYIDDNLNQAKNFILRFLKEKIQLVKKNTIIADFKTYLQEVTQAHGGLKVSYEVIDEKGPDHNKLFLVRLLIDGQETTTGEGKTKKDAEMEAAKKTLIGLNIIDENGIRLEDKSQK